MDEQLKADYADLGVSTGYIGNIYMGRQEGADDRSFRIFTKVMRPPRPFPLSDGREERITLHVFDVPRNHKGVWREPIAFDTPENRARLDQLRVKVQSGEYRVAL
jgi:hypothetical protein